MALTIGEETYEKLRALQGLLPDRDPAAIFDRAIGELLERTLARMAGITDPQTRTGAMAVQLPFAQHLAQRGRVEQAAQLARS